MTPTNEGAGVGWKPIETAPRDGRWFIIGCFGYSDPGYEIGRFDPLMHDKFVEVENGLYRKERFSAYDWQGFNNFHRATHWCDLPPLPAQQETER